MIAGIPTVKRYTLTNRSYHTMIKLEIVNREIALHICDLNGETFHPVISLADAESLAGLLDHVLKRQATRKTVGQLNLAQEDS